MYAPLHLRPQKSEPVLNKKKSFFKRVLSQDTIGFKIIFVKRSVVNWHTTLLKIDFCQVFSRNLTWLYWKTIFSTAKVESRVSQNQHYLLSLRCLLPGYDWSCNILPNTKIPACTVREKISFFCFSWKLAVHINLL